MVNLSADSAITTHPAALTEATEASTFKIESFN